MTSELDCLHSVHYRIDFETLKRLDVPAGQPIGRSLMCSKVEANIKTIIKSLLDSSLLAFELRTLFSPQIRLLVVLLYVSYYLYCVSDPHTLTGSPPRHLGQQSGGGRGRASPTCTDTW